SIPGARKVVTSGKRDMPGGEQRQVPSHARISHQRQLITHLNGPGAHRATGEAVWRKSGYRTGDHRQRLASLAAPEPSPGTRVYTCGFVRTKREWVCGDTAGAG